MRNSVIKCVLYFILSFSISVYAEVDMQILPGFDGYHKHGCWLPLRITLTSSGGSVSGGINWENYVSDTDSTQIYSRPAEVFDIAKNIQYLYIFPETYRRNLSIKFVDDNGKELMQKEVSLKNVSPDERLIVVVSDNAGGLEFLANRQTEGGIGKSESQIPPNPPLLKGGNSNDLLKEESNNDMLKGGSNYDISWRENHISYVTGDLLPDSWKGYDSVDVLVLGDFSLSDLSDDQQQAVTDWVYNGGCLIVSGGAYSQNLAGTFVERLLPVRINGTSILDSLESLSQRYGYDTGKTIIASSELIGEGTAVIYEGDKLPLIAERQPGYGKTVFLAFDYLDPAIKSWEGKREMWREILPEPMSHDYSEDRDISRILLATEYKGPLSYKWAGLLFLLYILCFVTLNPFVLKRTGKALLIWLGMPAVSLIFVMVTLGFNYNLKGQAVIINDLSIVDLYQESGRGKITSYFGLFSPANRDYGLDFPERIFIRDIQPKGSNAGQGRDYKLVEDEIFEMKMSKSRILKPALFRGESYVELNGKVSLELDEGSGGKVTSELPFDLTECYVFSNGYRAYIGDLGHDKTVNINTSGDVPGTHSRMGGERQRFFNSMRQKLSGSITGKGLIGWADESALRKFLKMKMDVEYKTVGTMLVIVHI